MRKEKQQGITLIALIITIIVMLILVAVTVRTAVNSGLFGHAKNAVEKWGKAQEDELNLADKIDEQLEDIETPKINDPNPGVLEGEGTEENPYLICSIEDLVALSYNTNTLGNKYEGCYIELPISLNFKSDKSYVNPNRTILQVGENTMYGSETNTVTLKEYLNTVGFDSIGELKAIINGKNNTIANLYMHNPNPGGGSGTIGLFGLLQGVGEMKNLTTTGKIEIDNQDGKYDGHGISVGGITGYGDVPFNNCHSSVEISVKNINTNLDIRRSFSLLHFRKY